jgi:cytidylate kinase
LRPAPDAVHIDTSSQSVEESLAVMLEEIARRG